MRRPRVQRSSQGTFADACGVGAGLDISNDLEQIVFGERHVWGGSRPFGILPSDHRHPVYVIGKTGSGKTTLHRNLLLQHIERGHGVGLIDPHGDLAQEILDRIPRWRAHHLARFTIRDPSAQPCRANVSRRMEGQLKVA